MHFSFSTFVALAACVSATFVLAQDTTPTQPKDAFDKATIPKDLHLNFKPKGLLDVTFPQPKPASGPPPPPVTVQKGGEELPKNATERPPAFRLRAPVPAEIGKGPFVVAIVDPDAPTPESPTDGPVRHFLGGDFVLNDDGATLANNTPAITEYQQPNPGNGSKPHRCVFLLFKQPNGFKDQKEVTPDSPRPFFNVSGFAQKVGLGDPVAGTFVLVAPQN